MKKNIQSSRDKFTDYKQDFLNRDRKKSDQRAEDGKNGGEQSGDEKSPKHQRERSSWQLVRDFFGLLKGHRGSIAFSLGTLTVATILALLPPAATKFVVDYVFDDKLIPESVPAWIPRDQWNLLITITIAVFAVSVVRMVLHVWGRWHATRVTKLVQMSVRKRAYEHMVRLPLYRVQELKSGGAASILRQDAGSVGDLVFGMLYNPWRALIQLIGSLIILAVVDWTLLLGAIVLVPVVFLSHRTWISRIRPQFRSIRKQRELVDGQVTESFGGMRVVRAFSRQRAEANRIMRGNHLMGRKELYAWWWARIVEIIWETIIPLCTAGLLIYGGWQVIHQQLTMGDLMMFLAFVLMLLGPLAVLAQSAATFQNGLSGLDRILDLLEEDREMVPDANSIVVEKSRFKGDIALENVSFQYPGTESFALRDISLDVAAGETIALVGASGAGKTTLCNLVARFYDPTSGRIVVDGTALTDISVESYRLLTGIVEQDVFLFDGSVAENISYGGRDVGEADIRNAAEIANAAGFIEDLPQGFDTVIGERGVKLSGGQRQRLAIARAVLADPRILILDEATSNLDTESERLIQQSMLELMQGRTCFVIAHRLSTIMHADRISVMESGRIIEIGTHSELLNAGGNYTRMVQMQTSDVIMEQESG